MAKMTNKQKLEALKKWLSENNIEYLENYKSRFGVTMDLKIPSLKIAVFLSNDVKQGEWERGIFHAQPPKCRVQLFHVYKPFFVRESETKAFVLEKIQNCCYDRMVWLQKQFEKKQKAQPQ